MIQSKNKGGKKITPSIQYTHVLPNLLLAASTFSFQALGITTL